MWQLLWRKWENRDGINRRPRWWVLQLMTTIGKRGFECVKCISDTCMIRASSNGKFSALLAICAGNPSITGGFPSQRPATRSFNVSLICAGTNGWENNQDTGDLNRHRPYYDVTVMTLFSFQIHQILGDLSEKEQVQHIMDSTIERWGKLDVLVRNHGALPLSWEWEQIIAFHTFWETLFEHIGAYEHVLKFARKCWDV